jgi:hypothetical protein
MPEGNTRNPKAGKLRSKYSTRASVGWRLDTLRSLRLMIGTLEFWATAAAVTADAPATLGHNPRGTIG